MTETPTTPAADEPTGAETPAPAGDTTDATAADAAATDAPAEPEAVGGTGSSGALTSEAQAPQTPADVPDPSKPLGEQREEQQEKAGEDPDADPKPLAQSDNLTKSSTTTVAGKDFDLPLDTQVALKAQASQATSIDAQGVERVIDRYVDGWVPAPVHPDPKEVERLEVTQEALEAHRKERQELLGLRDTSGAGA